jgi:hypothetical protein
MTQQTQHQIGLSGGIHGYNVIVLGDLLTVTDGDGLVTQQTVAGLGAFIGRAGDVRLGWGRFEDDMEVLYLYDKADGNFGYALNLLAAWCSEWGYAPFR